MFTVIHAASPSLHCFLRSIDLNIEITVLACLATGTRCFADSCLHKYLLLGLVKVKMQCLNWKRFTATSLDSVQVQALAILRENEQSRRTSEQRVGNNSADGQCCCEPGHAQNWEGLDIRSPYCWNHKKGSNEDAVRGVRGQRCAKQVPQIVTLQYEQQCTCPDKFGVHDARDELLC